MNPQPPNPKNQKPPRDFGEPLPLEELLDFAEIEIADIEAAAQWWDDAASADFVGALDSEPVNDNT